MKKKRRRNGDTFLEQEWRRERKRKKSGSGENGIDVRSGYATFREFESEDVDPAGNSYLAHILKLETWTI